MHRTSTVQNDLLANSNRNSGLFPRGTMLALKHSMSIYKCQKFYNYKLTKRCKKKLSNQKIKQQTTNSVIELVNDKV